MVLLALLCVQQGAAQQDPLFAQYNSNAFLINPAVAGSQGNQSINLFHRWQWVSFPGAPQTFGLTYQGMLPKKKAHTHFIGVGALLFGDVTGPSSRWGGKISIAGHIRLSEKIRLSIGLAGRIAHQVIRTDMIQLIDPNDIAIANADQGVTGGDLEAGVFLYTRNLSIGFAAPNILQTRLDFGNGGNRDLIGQRFRHYFLSAAYKFRIPAKKMIVEPSLMVKYVQGTLPQVDGGVTLHVLDEQLAFGVFYRSPAFLSFQCKFLFDRKIPVLIGFDLALNTFQQHSLGATEFMLGYEFDQVDIFSTPNPEGTTSPEGEL